ncbi:MAG TPA: alpha/beta fold hydrolase [Acidimicrobiales bacterium]
MALRSETVESFAVTTPEAARPMEPLRLVEPVAPTDSSMDVQASGLFLQALARTVTSAVMSPMRVASATTELAGGVLSAGTAAAARAVGKDVPGPIAPSRDPRFADPTWEDNALYWLTRQLYLLRERFVDQLIDAAPIDETTKAKAALAASILSDATAPTNTLLGNPAAIQRAFQTGGLSLVRGARNLLHDVRHNQGWPAQVEPGVFRVGENMACTPGRVVYRSDLFELIQYEPQTELVHEIPLLFCPPWINKYYIFDLAPGRSLIEWAVTHGHTCFAISYRNPDESMRSTTFEDYLLQGPVEAIDVVRSITGSELVNTMSVCLGGTLSALTMAYDAARGDRRVNAAGMINTHTDFTRAGVLGAFTDEATITMIEQQMEKAGILPSNRVARTFSLIRANEMIFNYVVQNWLQGETPPAFDLLAWNDDGTNMPGRMHGQFLRWFYLENRFAEGGLELGGQHLDPGLVDQSTYVVSGVNDHIVPWESAYQTTQLLGGDDKRFVLSSAGHIAAIINPPGPKAKLWANDELPADHDEWKAGAVLEQRSWWDDWTDWLSSRAGDLVAPPAHLGSELHPPIAEAPGAYVMA